MMFALVSRYTLPAGQVSALTAAHSEWIARHYASGRILVSGRRDPAAGGVIIAYGNSLAEIEEWITGDPFVVNGAAEYEITAFTATDYPKRCDAFDAFAKEAAQLDVPPPPGR